MVCNRFQRVLLTRCALAVLIAVLVTGGPACFSGGSEVLQPDRPAIELEELAVPQREPEVVKLAPEEAAQIANQVRQEVSVELADGFDLDLWAPDQLVKDPVAIDIDDQGRLYYTRTNRQKNSEFDIRGHRDWMVESIQLESVEDRRAFLHRVLAPERSAENDWMADVNGDGSRDWRDLTVEKEQAYRVEDTDGDGLADEARLFIEDFNTEVTDVAGGIFAYGDTVYLAVAPDLWRLRDTSGDGMADVKTSLSHGYQAHIGFGGHGMSGVMMGPDGRVYWSIGDIGLNVVGPDGRRWAYPHQGAILRANPDGSDFEVFAAGLRNTHEFVFDEYGNLISVDNDGDHAGEHERVVYVVYGSDSGWRTNWQFGKYVDPDNNEYKVWMEEELYKPRFEGQAAYITPPVAAYHSGPAGMVYNPGTALSDAWRDYFFVAEFTGSPNSKINAFRLEPKGATFELADDKQVVRGLNATGLAWGPDGALYFADWVEGWNAKDQGRVWKLDTPAAANAAVRAETERLLGASFDGRSDSDLLNLLKHPDQRVRLKAQFELAGRGDAETLLAAARQRDDQIARLHGLWGIGQLARQDAREARPLVAFLDDADPEIRAQAAKLVGDIGYAPAAGDLIPLLKDSSARARFFAAEALGRLRHRPAVQPIIAMLEANNDEDAYLRHAGSLALAQIGDAEPIVALADHPSRALRIAAVVALRRMRHEGVARFLEDDDEYIVTEAARATNDDVSIEAALPALARVLERPEFTSEALIRRAINANLRLGTAEAAQRVAAYATRSGAPEEMRAEAVAVLGVWPKPSVLDRVDGHPRGAVERDPAIARAALAPIVNEVLTGGPAPVKIAAAEAIGRLDIRDAAPALFARIETDASPEVRIAALHGIQTLGDARLEEAVRTALADRETTVRMAALRIIPALSLPEPAVADMLASVLEEGSVEEQQSALEALGQLSGPEAERVLGTQLDRLVAGTLPSAIQLDVMEAVEASPSDALHTRLAQYRAAQPADDPLAEYREALLGGDVMQGRRVFIQHPAAQCIRCHAVNGRGGDVGPDLAGIGARVSREYLLESLVDPSAELAPGYGVVTLTLNNGETVTGTLMRQEEDALLLHIGTDESRRVPLGTIVERENAPSGMPPMGHLVTRRELRDLVEFLVSLK